jgi:hypothetical protein
MKIIITLIILTAHSVVLAGGGLSRGWYVFDDFESQGEDWISFCTSEKERYSTEFDEQQGFNDPRSQGFWSRDVISPVLEIQGVSIPLPTSEYIRHSVTSLGEGEISILLKTRSYSVILTRTKRLYFDSLWSNDEGDIKKIGNKTPSKEQQITQEIYGHDIDLFSLILDSFNYNVNDLRCEQKSKMGDIRALIALQGKMTTYSTKPPRVYKLVKKSVEGYVEERIVVGRKVIVLKFGTKSELIEIEYVIKDQADIYESILKSILNQNENPANGNHSVGVDEKISNILEMFRFAR